jgi:hypothetical protein
MPGVTEARAVRARIAGLGRALQDPIDQQILWHLLSAERKAQITLHVILAPGDNLPELDTLDGSGCHQQIGEITPSRTAELVQRPQPEIRVHYRLLHEAGLIERGRRILRLGRPEHTYTLSAGLRPVLEAVSDLVLPNSPDLSAAEEPHDLE